MILIKTRWKIAPEADPTQLAELASALNIPETLAALLIQRGYTSPPDAIRFLRPTLESLSDPMSLKDMPEAVAEIAATVRAGRTILVHGDYDVDGQCATALLTRVLREAGADVEPFVPHRIRDGYDFGEAGLAQARASGAALIITCDCGTTAIEAVRAANAEGIRVIVTDHHLSHEMPPAAAVVNPQRPDCPFPHKELCGTGVAFKLAQALVKEFGLPETLPWHFIDLVALATVADVVPLVGENRTLVRFGLKTLAASRWPGVRALVEVTGLKGKPLRAGHVGYVLAPRLNAAGRIGDAMDGLRLLLSDDDDDARARARALETINGQRRDLDSLMLDEVLEDIEERIDFEQTYGLVLAREGWHPGVIGLVASRIVERYGRPTIVVALEGDEGRGSGRSIPAFDLHAALTACAQHLERYGGHRMAVGLNLQRDRLEHFRSAFNQVARSELSPDDVIPTQRVDTLVSISRLDDELERLLRHLEPCGSGNPGPVLGVVGGTPHGARVVGTNHLRFTLGDGTGRIAAIGFDWADRVESEWGRQPVDVAFRLERNEWNGKSVLQARVVQIKRSEIADR